MTSRTTNKPWIRVFLAAVATGLATPGCNAPSSESDAGNDVIASLINVTPFDVSVVVSAVLNDAVDTVNRTVRPSATSDVTFACVDQLVVGDPLSPDDPGVTIQNTADPARIDAFAVLRGESFQCGDIVEIIISGSTPDDFTIDVFALTPPARTR